MNKHTYNLLNYMYIYIWNNPLPCGHWVFGIATAVIPVRTSQPLQENHDATSYGFQVFLVQEKVHSKRIPTLLQLAKTKGLFLCKEILARPL